MGVDAARAAGDGWAERALDALEDPVVTLEPVRGTDGEIVDFVYRQANLAACDYNGLTREELIGARLLELFPGLRAAGMFQGYVDVVTVGDPVSFDGVVYDNELLDGEPRRYDIRLVQAGQSVVVTWRDVSARAEAMVRMTRLAHTDSLTGLISRVQGTAILRRLLDEDSRSGTGLAVAFLDVDGLKQVNDALGHAIGDALLQAISVRIRACLRESDTVIRHGGDEIVVLLRGVDAVADARAVCQKILDSVSLPLTLDGHPVAISASIGLTMAAQGDTPSTILHRADSAMYQAKQAGGHRVEIDDLPGP